MMQSPSLSSRRVPFSQIIQDLSIALCYAIHHTLEWRVGSPNLWLFATKLLFMAVIIVIMQLKDNEIVCVCLICAHSSCFRGNLILVRRARRPHLHVCVDPRAYGRIFEFSLAFYVCFWSWRLVCWQVVCVCQEGGGLEGGDSGPFETDIRSESGSEAARERASFMWLCIPPRHSQAEAQDKTCVPPTVVTPPPIPPSPLHPPSPLYPASTPPLCQWP